MRKIISWFRVIYTGVLFLFFFITIVGFSYALIIEDISVRFKSKDLIVMISCTFIPLTIVFGLLFKNAIEKVKGINKANENEANMIHENDPSILTATNVTVERGEENVESNQLKKDNSNSIITTLFMLLVFLSMLSLTYIKDRIIYTLVSSFLIILLSYSLYRLRSHKMHNNQQKVANWMLATIIIFLLIGIYAQWL